MSFPRYGAYKDSGVEWLGEVPAHWEVISLARITDAKCDGPFGSGITSDHYTDSGALVVRLQNIRATGFFPGDPAYLALDYFEGDLLRHNVLPGDVLVAGLGDDKNLVGRACVAPDGISPALVKADCFRFRLTARVANPSFVAIQLSSGAACDSGRLSTGSTRSRIPLSVMATRKLAFPPLDEQVKVVAFLDRETAKIDELVAEQRNLIALLKEKRQALISHAVTKGLDPATPMKDSGVEWLGEVPAHWDVRALKHLVSTPITDGPHETPHFPDEGVPFVSAEAVSSGKIDFSKIRGFISHKDHLRYSQKYRPQIGDIYMVKSGATTGVTAIVETEQEFNIWSPLAAIRCSQQVVPYFVLNFMRSKNFQEAVTLNWSYGTQQNIGMRVIENLCVSVPPISEQTEITRLLCIEAQEVESLIDEAHIAIDLLVERRTALISAAVTGKIDVRGKLAAADPVPAEAAL